MKPTPRPLEAILNQVVGPFRIAEKRKGVTPQMRDLHDDQLARFAQFSASGSNLWLRGFYTASAEIFREFGGAGLQPRMAVR